MRLYYSLIHGTCIYEINFKFKFDFCILILFQYHCRDNIMSMEAHKFEFDSFFLGIKSEISHSVIRLIEPEAFE